MSLKHVYNRVVVEIDLQSKNFHTFSDGTKIRLERQYENLNRRHTEPVNAIVIDAEYIPAGTQILVHPNAATDTNIILNYHSLSGKHEDSEIKYFSVPVEQCYAWLDGTEWKPLKGFEFGLRVYRPYEGVIDGVKPTKIKNVLYITTGYLKGRVVHTLNASDYQIIFQDINGREGSLIRCRHFEQADENEREEVIAIDHSMTKKVNEGKLLIGISSDNAQPLTENVSDYRMA